MGYFATAEIFFMFFFPAHLEKRQKTNNLDMVLGNETNSSKNTNQELNGLKSVSNESVTIVTKTRTDNEKQLSDSKDAGSSALRDKTDVLNKNSEDLFENEELSSSKRLSCYDNSILTANDIKCSSKQTSGIHVQANIFITVSNFIPQIMNGE